MDHYCEVRLAGREGTIGKEIFEITPIIFGGSAIDPANKTFLSREQHIAAVQYWNQVIRDLQKHSSASGS